MLALTPTPTLRNHWLCRVRFLSQDSRTLPWVLPLRGLLGGVHFFVVLNSASKPANSGSFTTRTASRSSAAYLSYPARSLENWLRKQARSAMQGQLDAVTTKLRRQPGKVLIMGQRTKWGNCSPLQNLSFNWRLILAPETVLQYLVTHEAVHLAVPDHSQQFWLTVRSLCPETERAKQWLSANGHRLLVDLNEVCGQAS
jgi:predicted metal-dependent hydrolase